MDDIKKHVKKVLIVDMATKLHITTMTNVINQ